MLALPSRKVTCPVGIFAPWKFDSTATVAVNVKFWAKNDGFPDEITVVVLDETLVLPNTPVLRGSWRTRGQSLRAALNFTPVLTILTTPGTEEGDPVTSYATAMSAIPS